MRTNYAKEIEYQLSRINEFSPTTFRLYQEADLYSLQKPDGNTFGATIGRRAFCSYLRGFADAMQNLEQK